MAIHLLKDTVTSVLFDTPTILMAPSRNFSHEILVSDEQGDDSFIEVVGTKRFAVYDTVELLQKYAPEVYVPQWPIDIEPDPAVPLHDGEDIHIIGKFTTALTFEVPTLLILETTNYYDKYMISRYKDSEHDWFPINSRQVMICIGTVYIKSEKDMVINCSNDVKTAERRGTVVDFTRSFLSGLAQENGYITLIEINEDDDTLDITADSGDTQIPLEYLLADFKNHIKSSEAGENITKEEFLTYCKNTAIKTGTYSYTGTDNEDDDVIYIASITENNSVCYTVSVTKITTINAEDL